MYSPNNAQMTMTRKTHILSLPAFLGMLVLSCACGKIIQPDPDPENGTDGISFSASAVLPEGWQPLTKAYNIDSTDDLKDNASGKAQGFGVYAYYTQSFNYDGPASNVQVVLANRQVKFARDYSYDVATESWKALGSDSDKAWVYYGKDFYGTDQPAYKEYWPMKDGEKMTFFAYAPWYLWNGEVRVSETGAVPTIPYTIFTSGNSSTAGAAINGSNVNVTVKSGTFGDTVQRDLLWGVQSTGYTYKNFTRPSVTTDEHEENTVKFYFRHALSKLRFNILMETEPEVNEASLSQFDPNRSTSSSYPMKTVYLVESVRVWSEDNLLYNSSTLSLDNVAHADQPDWSGQSGAVTYSFGSDILGQDILYVKNNDNTSSSDENRYKFSTLLGRRTTIDGMTSDSKTLMGNNSNELYAIPASGHFKVAVTYHKLTFYYHSGGYGWGSWNGWTVFEEGTGKTKTGTIAANLEAGRAYDLNIILSDDSTSGPLELVLQTQPWEMSEFSYDYTTSDYSVIEHLTFDSDYMDYRIDDKVYINNRVGKFTFRVDGGKYLYWRASLIGDNAFAFTDQFGNYLTDTSGDLLTMLPGTLDPDVSNEIYIKALNTSSTVLSRARLRLYFYTGNNESVVPLNLINLTDANGDRILEWTVVQNAN